MQKLLELFKKLGNEQAIGWTVVATIAAIILEVQAELGEGTTITVSALIYAIAAVLIRHGVFSKGTVEAIVSEKNELEEEAAATFEQAQELARDLTLLNAKVANVYQPEYEEMPDELPANLTEDEFLQLAYIDDKVDEDE